MSKAPNELYREGADLIVSEMSTWLGMDEKATRREVADVVAEMTFPNTLAALRSAAEDAYLEVMRRQAAKFAMWDDVLLAQGWHNFIDRVTEALAQERQHETIMAVTKAHLRKRG